MVDIAIEDLTFAYPGQRQPALRGVSVSVPFGSFVCVCGPSGCGKTTLLRQLRTVLAPHGTRSGRVLVNGTPLEEIDLRTQSALIGFVMQDPESQLVCDKVWHELAFGLENLGVDPDAMRLRVAEMASFFGMAAWMDEDVSDLSGGQKQLLNLASVMAMQPSVLVLDEPTAQLDPIASADFLNAVRKINVELGTTVIVTEHRLEDVFAHADAVVVMEEGGVVAQGSPREVADILHRDDAVMARALPAPARIYHGVTDSLAMRADGERAAWEFARSLPCPLSVREGRDWLTSVVLRFPPRKTALPARHAASGDGASALEFENVWFRYDRDGKDILRGLDLTVPQGVVAAVMGANGSGKSTMLKCACGLARPYRGSLRVFGEKASGMRGKAPLDAGVAMLPQNPQGLFAQETVRAELDDMASRMRVPDEGSAERIERVVELCEIGGLLDRHPLDLSGGEQQRAALALVLLGDPRLVLLDEPTKGIDCIFKERLAKVLASLAREGTTILMVSHDIEFCARHAQQVSLLFDGGISATADARSFFAQNSFYTTAANRMSRNLFANAVTDDDVIELCETLQDVARASGGERTS